MMSSNKTRIFPKFTVQEHPAPWPDPSMTGAKKVLSVAKFEPGGPEDAAHIICLHLFKENVAINASRLASFQATQEKSVAEQLDGEKDTNLLFSPEVTCA